ncbi:MAG TPA: hypothetical protein VM347_28255 [Nonomuraea sp.]|nr:hypothetical protein [Nonomuraea sp.]
MATIVADGSPITCDDRSVLECAFATGPVLIERVAELLVVAVGVSAVLLVLGTVVIFRGRRRALPLVAGTAMVVPPLWFAGSVAALILGFS